LAAGAGSIRAIDAQGLVDNALMSSSRSVSFGDTWRGAMVALAFVLVSLMVFLLFAFGRHVNLSLLTKPETKSEKVPRPEVSPPNAPKKDDDDTQPPGAPSASGFPGVSTSHAANNAADALRQALEDYKADPKKTTIVSISTSGHMKMNRGGELTTFDGLPADAVKGGTMLTASGTSRAGSARQ
jgi:hypothetical protein